MAAKAKFKVERSTPFGNIFMPDIDHDLVVVCGNRGGGYEPICVRLPHQVYVKEFSKVEGLSLLPVRSADHIDISEIGHTWRERTRREKAGK